MADSTCPLYPCSIVKLSDEAPYVEGKARMLDTFAETYHRDRDVYTA